MSFTLVLRLNPTLPGFPVRGPDGDTIGRRVTESYLLPPYVPLHSLPPKTGTVGPVTHPHRLSPLIILLSPFLLLSGFRLGSLVSFIRKIRTRVSKMTKTKISVGIFYPVPTLTSLHSTYSPPCPWEFVPIVILLNIRYVLNVPGNI